MNLFLSSLKKKLNVTSKPNHGIETTEVLFPYVCISIKTLSDEVTVMLFD